MRTHELAKKMWQKQSWGHTYWTVSGKQYSRYIDEGSFEEVVREIVAHVRSQRKQDQKHSDKER